jgi:hypothetical protein
MAGFTLDEFSNLVSRSWISSQIYTCMHMSDKWSWYYPLAQVDSWSLSRISQFGYLRGHATKKELNLEVSMHALLARIYPYAYKLSHSFPSLLQFVNSDTKKVEDSFRIIRTQGSSWKIMVTERRDGMWVFQGPSGRKWNGALNRERERERERWFTEMVCLASAERHLRGRSYLGRDNLEN